MKACKFYALLFILMTFSFQVLALDCNEEGDVSISSDHWLREESIGLQIYAIGYLSSKALYACMNENLPEKRLVIRKVLVETIGEDKVKTLETEFGYWFDSKSALKELGIDVFDENTSKEIKSFNLKHFAPHQGHDDSLPKVTRGAIKAEAYYALLDLNMKNNEKKFWECIFESM